MISKLATGAAVTALCALLCVQPAHAQMSPERLNAWLCKFFQAPDPALLAQFPDYGMGPLKETTRFRAAARGGYTVHEIMVSSEAYKFRYSYMSRAGRAPYGFGLEISGQDATLWPTQNAAREALASTGEVKVSAGRLIAENSFNRDLRYYGWRAEFDTEMQELVLSWQGEEDSAPGRGFCQ